MTATSLPDFCGVRAQDLVNLERFVAGLDFWPLQLRGLIPKSRSLHAPTPTELKADWTHITRTPVFVALMANARFRDAYEAFEKRVNPDISQKIRYFNIVLHALHAYLIESRWPRFMGIGTAAQRQRAIKGAQSVLDALRHGVHLGTDRIHENQTLATLLGRYIHELQSSGSVRRDETLAKRRFFDRLICEFLIAFKKPLTGVLRHFYELLTTRGRAHDPQEQHRIVTRYVMAARKHLALPPAPRATDWYGTTDS